MPANPAIIAASQYLPACKMPTLGVAMISRNAAAHLDACLAAVRWADRIVVLDSGSADNTLDIARAHGAEIHVSVDWPGFGVQKNRCLALLDTDWILALDADEVLSPELAEEIRAAVAAPKADVYALPRLSNYCGRWMHHSGWYPDFVPRLFKRGAARYSDDLVHERLIFAGEAVRLQHHLLHHSFDDLSQVLAKIDSYSSAGAQQRLARGERSGLLKAIGKGLWTFIRSYFLKRGFLDGREGFILAVSNAEGAYYRYLKLMYLGEKQ
ncbi:Glycosyltransferase involved in cell wall bisynthesis [Formivibrio citricus]|uniref:Glycosyltransferase involved in cell wall bisynthesis n=2 Tax=Formivibrio citricus TaxID=83765 RepID=A0A1I4VMB4_9NEIS|nr:Glycosyltransferase involved in cell wall bisynthesis [Formivibrio citricus]